MLGVNQSLEGGFFDSGLKSPKGNALGSSFFRTFKPPLQNEIGDGTYVGAFSTRATTSGHSRHTSAATYRASYWISPHPIPRQRQDRD